MATALSRMETWQECATWLTRCGVLREDHKVNMPDAVASDLAMTLRDGVLLCNLVIKIEPGAIDSKDINQKPRMAQFLCLRNIKLFLQACRETFNLKESDLFEPQFLFDLTDFLRVMQTLSKLSLSPKFQMKNITGFSFLKPRTLSQDEMYRNLSASQLSTSLNEMTVEPEEYSSYHVHMRNEEIYQDLCSLSRVRTSQLSTSLPVNLIEKRDYVINELVETEKNYVDVLGGLQRSFMKPLAPVIKEEDYKVIFFKIKDLYEVHVSFLTQLRKALNPSTKSRLSEVFLTWREKFLVYGDYIANLTHAQNRVQDLCNKNEFINTEVERCQQEANNGKFKLRDILSVPMQRILKYHLLLDKLVAETHMSHEDYRGLERAKEAMVDVAQYINEVKRDSDTIAILHDIEKSICDWGSSSETSIQLKNCGRLIIDGELRIKAHNDQKQKIRYVFVFDTAMILCKTLKGDQYSFKECLQLPDYKIQDVDRKVLTRDARWCHQWYLVHREERTAYTCYSRTEEFKKKWMKAITDALDNIEPPGCRSNQHRFHMHTFTQPTTCSHCSKFLKGKIYQGYLCERCQISCHKMCLSYCGRCGTSVGSSNGPQPLLPPRQSSFRAASPLLPSPPPLPPPPPPPPHTSNSSSAFFHRAASEDLSKYLWFVGELGRERAASLLENQPDGTYLVRIRPQGPTNPSETVYALSLKTDNRVKHMKICEKVIDGSVSYYLSVSRFFNSVTDLINYYQHTTLEENFVGLNVTLQRPFKQIVAVAEFDYNPTEPNQLPLRTGCQVIVVSKEGDDKGWWKGIVQNREGFFPKQYVREVSDTLAMGLCDIF